jgi:L-asparaginase II
LFNLQNEPTVIAEITRGSIVESRHRGAIVAIGPEGRLIAATGNIDFVTYLRSSAKPHQAMAVITSGAAARFQFTERELALMAGSHSGESYHAECAGAILTKLGLEKSALHCGIHTPFSRAAAEALGKGGVTELHNNCSGKHAGMLAQALHGNYSLNDYYNLDHPVQRYIASVIAEFAGMDRSELITGIDGCSAATFAMSIRQMALIYARLVNPEGLRSELESAARKVVNAMIKFPEMVAADKGRIDTELMRALPGQLVAKAGAEGVYTIGLLPSARYPQGLGIAIKIEDGDTSRARDAAIIGSLVQLGILSSEQGAKFSAQYLPPIKNHRGLIVGEIHPAFKLEQE